MPSALAAEAQRLLDDYLARLDRALRRVPQSQRDEIRVEIESHLRGRLAELPEPVTAADTLDVLYKLGEPESYVPLYLTESYLSQGFQKASPPLLAKGVGRWLGSAALSYLYSFPFFLLYLVSFLLLALGIGKLIAPDDVRVAYTSNKGRNISVAFNYPAESQGLHPSSANSADGDPSTDIQGHELLGSWAVPATLGLGFLMALGATVLLRRMTRRALRRRFED
ncbi:MAG TPA: hypothetical protein ENI60_07095 [Candidatus Fraserbacteria bacterium]|nr:hypothetical protein [Candidatus Fraserbacteria bacterium]